MRKIVLMLLAVGMAASAAAQDWTPLYNGKNLRGWKKIGGKTEFRAEGDAIVGVSKMGEPNVFLTTEKRYGDFILEFEFRADDGLNSGVQFRSQSKKEYNNGRVHGYQYEIDTAPRAWSGGVYDEATPRLWLYPLTYNQPARTAYKAGEWNKARIEAIGGSVRTWLNGVECSSFVDNVYSEGFIALQVHGIGNDTRNDGKTISWRDIRICTVDPAAHATPANPDVQQLNLIPNTISEVEKTQGWRLLWDGETTAGWRGARLDGFPTKGWNIAGGVLSVEPSDGGESTNGGDIVTVDAFADNFVLKADFSFTQGANSGIKYFVKPDMNKGEGSAIGCEYQILDDRRHPDAKLGVNGNRTLGSLYDLIPARDVNEAYLRPGFNTAMIVVKGGHVEHWLNGVKLVEYERGTQQWDALVDYSKYKDWPDFGNHARGHILLQDHGNAVSFRSVKILEMCCCGAGCVTGGKCKEGCTCCCVDGGSHAGSHDGSHADSHADASNSISILSAGTALADAVNGKVPNVIVDGKVIESIDEINSGNVDSVSVSKDGTIVIKTKAGGNALNTAFGDKLPIYIVNGEVRDGVDNIKPKNVDSITVLKGNKAIEVYGPSAADGVVIITTKKG